jgi:hypothetical protein
MLLLLLLALSLIIKCIYFCICTSFLVQVLPNTLTRSAMDGSLQFGFHNARAGWNWVRFGCTRTPPTQPQLPQQVW